MLSTSSCACWPSYKELLKLGSSKLQSVGHIQSTHRLFSFCSFMTQLRMVFTLYNDWKKSKEDEYFKTCENYMNTNFNVYKFLLEHDHIICLHTVYSCFYTAVAELRVVTGTVRPAKLRIFTNWSFTEKVC